MTTTNRKKQKSENKLSLGCHYSTTGPCTLLLKEILSNPIPNIICSDCNRHCGDSINVDSELGYYYCQLHNTILCYDCINIEKQKQREEQREQERKEQRNANKHIDDDYIPEPTELHNDNTKCDEDISTDSEHNEISTRSKKKRKKKSRKRKISKLSLTINSPKKKTKQNLISADISYNNIRSIIVNQENEINELRGYNQHVNKKLQQKKK
eukprot:354266_1